MFATVSMMRIHRSRNFEKVKMCKTNSNFEKLEITVNLIYSVCAMSEMIT